MVQHAQQFFDNLKIWVLSDGKAGHLNQSLGVAEALGGDVEVIHLKKRKFGSFLSFFWPPLKVKNLPKAPWPHVVIGAGHLTVPVSKWVKMQNPSTVTVQMMTPLNRFGLKFKPDGFWDYLFNSQNLNFFDVIVSPIHEGQKSTDQTIVTIGAPNRVNTKRLEEEKLKWASTFNNLQGKRLAVLVGGHSKRFKFDEGTAQSLATDVTAFAHKQGYAIMATASRRTGQAQTDILKKEWTGHNNYFWNGEGGNPYMGMLACADAFVVTPDSTSMVSEACSTGKPVYIWGLDENMQRKEMGKFNHFYRALRMGGYIYTLSEKISTTPPSPLDETTKVAGFIRSHILKRLNAKDSS